MGKSLKIAFMGTPAFAVQALDAIIRSGHEVVCVYSQPPRPAGRGQQAQPSPVAVRAEELNIPLRTPQSLKKDAAARRDFAALNLDIAVVAAYGLILPQDVLDAPKHGCLNIHASLLPRWRGAAPIQRAILAGDAETGICIMQMEAGLDTGPVLMRRSLPITATTTAGQLQDDLAALGASLTVETLTLIAAGQAPPPQKQDDAGFTYASMLTKDDGRIDWAKPAADIERQLRALHLWPGIWCLHRGKILKVLEVAVEKRQAAPGTILDRHLTVACGQDALLLKKVQPQDRKPMDGASFMNGMHLNAGDCLL